MSHFFRKKARLNRIGALLALDDIEFSRLRMGFRQRPDLIQLQPRPTAGAFGSETEGEQHV